MTTELRGYSASIARYTGVTDQATLDKIEDQMRLEYRTLDHLSPAKFARCARESWQAVAYLHTPEGQAEWARLWAEAGMSAPR